MMGLSLITLKRGERLEMIATDTHKGYEIKTDGKSYSIYRGKYLILDNVQSSFLARNYIDTWDKFKKEAVK